MSIFVINQISYGLECISINDCRDLITIQCKLIKQSLGLSKQAYWKQYLSSLLVTQNCEGGKSNKNFEFLFYGASLYPA